MHVGWQRKWIHLELTYFHFKNNLGKEWNLITMHLKVKRRGCSVLNFVISASHVWRVKKKPWSFNWCLNHIFQTIKGSQGLRGWGVSPSSSLRCPPTLKGMWLLQSLKATHSLCTPSLLPPFYIQPLSFFNPVILNPYYALVSPKEFFKLINI